MVPSIWHNYLIQINMCKRPKRPENVRPEMGQNRNWQHCAVFPAKGGSETSAFFQNDRDRI